LEAFYQETNVREFGRWDKVKSEISRDILWEKAEGFSLKRRMNEVGKFSSLVNIVPLLSWNMLRHLRVHIVWRVLLYFYSDLISPS
jgi:hypothetical protein